MTTASSSSLPTSGSNVPNTLEKIAAWAGLALVRCNPTLSILETSDTSSVRVASAAILKASDNTDRLIVRLSIPLASDYNTNGLKLWASAQEISNTSLPSAFTS